MAGVHAPIEPRTTEQLLAHVVTTNPYEALEDSDFDWGDEEEEEEDRIARIHVAVPRDEQNEYAVDDDGSCPSFIPHSSAVNSYDSSFDPPEFIDPDS